MSQSVDNIDGYTVGKTHKTLTNASLGAFMMYACAAFIAAIQIALSIQNPDRNANIATVIIMGAVCLALAVGFTVLHYTSTQRKYTVLRNYANADGTLASEVRYLDGTTKITEHGNGDGFWKQLGGLMKATLAGK